MDRIWGIAIPFPEASITDLFSSFVESGCALELGEVAVNAFAGGAHVVKEVGWKLLIGYQFFLVGGFGHDAVIRVVVGVIKVWVGLRKRPFDLSNVDTWQEAEEEEEES